MLSVIWPTANKKILFPTDSRVSKTMVQFHQKSLAIVYVEIYQFNTYRMFRLASSVVSRIVHYPTVILVIKTMQTAFSDEDYGFLILFLSYLLLHMKAYRRISNTHMTPHSPGPFASVYRI